MKWTIEFETKICEAVIKTYVIDKSRQSISNFLILQQDSTGISEGSMKMKISNIKAILKELEVENTIPGGMLSNYSKQNKNIVKKILDENGL